MKKREEMTAEEIAFVEDSTMYQTLIEECGDTPEAAFDRANDLLSEMEEAYQAELRMSPQERLERDILHSREKKERCGYSQEWLDERIEHLLRRYEREMAKKQKN